MALFQANTKVCLIYSGHDCTFEKNANWQKSIIFQQKYSNGGYQDNFDSVYFFYKKILSAKKHVTSKNQLTKQKQANTNQ